MEKNQQIFQRQIPSGVSELISENILLADIIEPQYIAQANSSFENKSIILIEVKFTGLNALDGILRLEASISGLEGTFQAIPNNSVTIDFNSGVQYIENTLFTGRHLRVAFIKNSVTAGIINHIYLMSKVF